MARKIFDILPPRKRSGASEATEKSVREEPGADLSTHRVVPRRVTKRANPLSREDEFLATLAKGGGGHGKPPAQREQRGEGIRPKKKRIRMQRWMWIGASIVVLVSGFYGLGYLISHVDVELTTQKNFQPFDFEAQLKQSPSAAELAQGVLALEKVEKDVSSEKEYPATGQGKTVSRAHGTILVYNTYSTQPQVLVARTRFFSSDGKLFRLTQRIVVPGEKLVQGTLHPGSVAAEVIADQPGPDYNLGPTKFKIPGFAGTSRASKFYGVSGSPFTGGASGQGKLITQTDIQNAEQDISQVAFDAAKTALAQSLPNNIKALDQATQLKVTALKPSAKPGASRDSFKVSIQLHITALLFDELAVKDLATKSFPQASSTQDVMKPVYDISYEPSNIDFKAGTMILHVKGSQNVEKSIDILALAQALVGKNADEVKTKILSLDGVQEAKVSFWPFWVKRIPSSIDRITLTIH